MTYYPISTIVVEYEDMSKRQLMEAIGKLERKLDRAEADNTSMLSDMDENRGKTEGKSILLCTH